MMGLHALRMAIQNLFQFLCLSSTCNSIVLRSVCVGWLGEGGFRRMRIIARIPAKSN
jgi:hypothetical protein